MITKIVTCIKITIKNLDHLYLTDSDQDVVFENITYRAITSFTPNSIINSNELAHDNFSISGVVDNIYITEEKIKKGSLSNAYLEVFTINVLEKTLKKNILKTGWIGEVKYSNGSFVIDVNSIGHKTKNLIGNCYSYDCRAKFGDQFCKKKLSDYSFEGSVTFIKDSYSFVDEKRNEPDDYFSKGLIIFETGEYIDKTYNIRSFNNKIIILEQALRLGIGDKFKIIAGCDKTLDSCSKKFDNVLNFRGEPFIPGQYKLSCT